MTHKRLFTFEDVKTVAGYRPTPYDDEEWDEFIAELDGRDHLSDSARLTEIVAAADNLLRDLLLREAMPQSFAHVNFTGEINRVREQLAKFV